VPGVSGTKESAQRGVSTVEHVAGGSEVLLIEKAIEFEPAHEEDSWLEVQQFRRASVTRDPGGLHECV
jgi:hypothetical protein